MEKIKENPSIAGFKRHRQQSQVEQGDQESDH